MRRLEEAILPRVGDFDEISIQMTALSLRSANPVSIGASLFNILVSLDPNRDSLGRMLINHEKEDNFDDAAEGTFDSMMDLFLRFNFSEVNGSGANDFFADIGSLPIRSVGGCWSHTLTAKPQFPEEGPNFFMTKCPFDLGIGIRTYEYLTGIKLPENPGTRHFPGLHLPQLGGGATIDLTPFHNAIGNEETTGLNHCFRNAQRGIGNPVQCILVDGNVIFVPEPPTLALLCAGLLGLAAARRRT